MEKFLRPIRGAVGMGLTWAAGWALFGVLIGVTSRLLPWLPWESFFEIFDAPLPALAIPGFFGGVFFSTVFGIAGRGRRFSELSLSRFAAWGAVGGVLLSLLPAALVTVGLATISPDAAGLWPTTAMILGPLTLLSAGSAAGTLMLARLAEGRDLPDAAPDEAESGLTGDRARESIGSGG